MISILYDWALHLAGLFALPKMLLEQKTKGKYRLSFWKKFGRHFPVIDKKNKRLIWIHAVSVGETKAVACLAKLFKDEADQPIILISSVTETGHADAKKNMAFADYHVFLPFDFSWLIKPIVRKVAPDIVIMSETDLWFNFLSSAKKARALTVVVNGKLSEKSAYRFEKLAFFSKRLFGLIDLFAVQSDTYLKRFCRLKIAESKLIVTGNIKFDGDYLASSDKQIANLKQNLGIKEGDQVIVIGSTHAPEEELLLAAFSRSIHQNPRVKLLVVPRHPERFDEVAHILQSTGFKLHRYSCENEPEAATQVILIDAMGLLKECYQLASVAIVAGSFTKKVGGHNVLEPMYYDVPVVFGPYMHSQPDLLELVLNSQSALQAKDVVEAEALTKKILNDFALRSKLVANGRKLIEQCKGATQRTYEAICKFSEEKK